MIGRLVLGALAAACVAGAWYAASEEADENRQAAMETHIQTKIEARTAEIRAGTYREAMGAVACQTEECEGHEAGFKWARDQEQLGARAENACENDSRSFKEGCEAYMSAEEEAETQVRDQTQGDDAE